MSDEIAAFYTWWNEKRRASYAVHAAAYNRNEPMPDNWGRFSELAEMEAWLARAAAERGKKDSATVTTHDPL